MIQTLDFSNSEIFKISAKNIYENKNLHLFQYTIAKIENLKIERHRQW